MIIFYLKIKNSNYYFLNYYFKKVNKIPYWLAYIIFFWIVKNYAGSKEYKWVCLEYVSTFLFNVEMQE